jgi:hypothetical protein
MDHQQAYKALDILRDYPAITEYIKSFEGKGGFMYTTETDPDRIALKKQMEDILDDGNHSGSTWGCMMRDIQAVLNGVITVEQLQEEDRASQEEYKAWIKARREETAAATAALIKEKTWEETAALIKEETEAETAALIKEETAVAEKKKRYTQV